MPRTSRSREELRQWAEIHKEEMQQAREFYADIFTVLVENSEHNFKRKPPIGLRFKIDPLTRLVVSPKYLRARIAGDAGSVDPQKMSVELVETTPFINSDGEEAYRTKKKMVIRWTPDEFTHTRWYVDSATHDAFTVGNALMRFCEDPIGTAQDNTDFCLVCGRQLTDGESRARGIGPECIVHLDGTPFGFAYTRDSPLMRGAK